MAINQSDLDSWVNNNLNVLFEGKHGVGKTAIVGETFNRHGLKWKYFSAATMDPWVDFIGIPRPVDDGRGGKQIELVRPAEFASGEIQAIFMDELNRAPPKVRNAVMELIQFKSINGIPFPNLRVVWAAINPDDEAEADLKYDVDVLDPAQRDRFQITASIPYKPDSAYFSKQYGSAGDGAVEWWMGLSKDAKDAVSPRRLEYAIQAYLSGTSLRHVITHKDANITKLNTLLAAGSIAKNLKLLEKAKADDRAKAFADVNFANNAFNHIIKKPEYIKAFIEYMPKDMVASLIQQSNKQSMGIAENAPSEFIKPMLEEMLDDNSPLSKGNKKRVAKLFATKSDNSDIVEMCTEVCADNFEDTVKKCLRDLDRCNVNKRVEIVSDIHSMLLAQSKLKTNTITKKDLVLSVGIMVYSVYKSNGASLNKTHNLSTNLKLLENCVINQAAVLGITIDDLATHVLDEVKMGSRKRKYFTGNVLGGTWSDYMVQKVRDYYDWF